MEVLMRLAIIAIFLATTAFGFFLKYLTYSRRNAPLPENVRDVYDEDEYRKNQAYKMEKLGFSIISGLVGMGFTLALLAFDVHHLLYGYISGITENIYLTSLFILVVPGLAISVIEKLVDIYDTFGIEARYGFNKTSAGTFVADFVKALLVGVVISGGLLSLFLLLHGWLGNWVFPAFFFVLVVFSIFLNFIAPFIIRIFDKLTPLEDGELKDRILEFAQKTGYKLKGIYVVDGSRRSTKMNAFATGFGKTKTIGLYDTLVEKLTHDEVVAVLAHEIGHAKKRHIVKRIPFSFVSFAILVAAAYFIVAMPEVSQAFGFAEANIAFGIFVLSIMLAPVMLVLRIPGNALSRKFEYEADAFEVEQAGKEPAASALKKLYRDSMGNLTPHPFVVMMEDSHPTLTQRLAAMERA